jgi:RNA polymerase sigma-70 factor (ECF subfamily)
LPYRLAVTWRARETHAGQANSLHLGTTPFVLIGKTGWGPRLNDAVDDNAVRACQRGDKTAYATLVEKHYRHVFALCLGMMGNVHDAEDLAQEAMLKGFSNIHTLTMVGRFEPWVLKITRNLCLDALRKQKRLRARIVKKGAESAKSPEENHDLERAIRRLPLEVRLPLTMYYFEQRNAASIARKLNISHSLVCQRIRTARDELHALLTEGDRHET